MRRALAVFSVSAGGLRLRVRLLPTILAVDREYRKRVDGRRRRGGLYTYAYFAPRQRTNNHYIGTIGLPADGRLTELVPHEVVHAVMLRLGSVVCDDDEELATLTGKLTARIHSRLDRLGLCGVAK